MRARPAVRFAEAQAKETSIRPVLGAIQKAVE